MALALLALTAPAGCGDIDRLPRQPNERSEAIISVPAFGDLGETIVVDASASTDPDGIIIEYRFDFGDQDETLVTAESIVGHVYREPGDYTVAVTVVDDRGGKSTDAAPVSVR